MAASAATIANTPELLWVLAEQIRNQELLATLRLTSRTFAAAVTPFLFADIRIKGDAVRKLRGLSTCEHIRHARRLRVDHSGNVHECNDTTQQMLRRMPRLESFSWHNNDLAEETLKALHEACPRLTALYIEYPKSSVYRPLYNFNEDEDESHRQRLERANMLERFQRPDFTVFSGLQELTMLNFNQNVPGWQQHLVQVLLNNRATLRHLALAEPCRGSYADHFIAELCGEYGATGAPPLQLRSMRLGHARYRFAGSSLERLADLSHLRDVHIGNEVCSWGGGGLGDARDTIGPAQCPNLRRLTVAHYRADVRLLFAEASWIDPDWLRQVALVGERMRSGVESAALLRGDTGPYRDMACPVHLRMLDIDLRPESGRLVDEAGRERTSGVRSVDEVFAGLVQGDRGTLEGLAVRLPGRTDLAFVDRLVQALAQLASITQLAIVYEDKLIARWLMPEKLANMARQLAAGVPSLRHIKAGSIGWRIWRGSTGAVQLEQLDGREMEDVELFSLLTRTTDGEW